MRKTNLYLNFKTIFKCRTKLSFVLIGGGAAMLLLVALFFFNEAKGQMFPPYWVECGQLELVVTPVAYNPQPICTDCCAEGTCQKKLYNVSLRALPDITVPINPWPTNGNFTLQYTEMYITLNLNKVNGVVSNVNEALTESCLALFLQSGGTSYQPDYQANDVEDEVTLQLSSIGNQGEPPVQLPGIIFTNGVSPTLFTVVIDAFPGEEIGLICTDFTYESLALCNNQCPVLPYPTAVFPYPNLSNTLATLSLESANCNAEYYIDVPVMINVSADAGLIRFLDFEIEITTNGPELAGIPTYLFFNDLSDPMPLPTLSAPVPLNNNAGYAVSGKYMIQPSGAFNIGQPDTMFILRIPRPVNLCQGYTITATLKPGRIEGYNAPSHDCYRVAVGNTVAQCGHPPVPICSNTFTFDVHPDSNLPDSCGTLKVFADLKFSPDTLTFSVFQTRIDFTLGTGASIANAYLEGIPCPLNNSPISCSPTDCVTWGTNYVDVCILSANGFTVINQGQVRVVIEFNTPSGCILAAQVRKMVLKTQDEGVVCQPDINLPVGFPICPPLLEGDIAREDACYVESVKVKFSPVLPYPLACTINHNADACGPYSLCPCPIDSTYKITPTKNDNRLNGVTTYDLVLISKHVIGIEPLNSPYKIISADANKSRNVTSFDIVEFRKLILGIYDSLPLNKSWQFIAKRYVFPNPQNPWVDSNGQIIILPENDSWPLGTTNADFIAMKIGDVNLSAVVCDTACMAFQRPAGNFKIGVSQRTAAKAGEYLTIPIRAADNQPLTAWQMALRFDPDALELIAPSIGDLPGLTADNFGLTRVQEGILKTLWFAQPSEEAAVKPGAVLFNLSFRAKHDIAETASLLSLDERLMPCNGWLDNGTGYDLKMASAPRIREQNSQLDQIPVVLCRPNPTEGEVTFEIADLPKYERARLTVMDAFGHQLWSNNLAKETTPTQISVREAATWPTGIYHWELRWDKERTSGTFIRH